MGTKREVEDTLRDVERGLLDSLEEAVTDYLNDNPDTDTAPDYETLDYNGRIHEEIDAAVPIYYSELDALWYFHKNRFLDAYELAGIGTDPTENSYMVAIYCYLSEVACNWFAADEHEAVFDKWQSDHVSEK